MSDIKPELIGKALTAAVKWAADRGETTSAGQITAALTAVADDLWAEAKAEALREAADEWGAGEWQEAWLADAVEDDVSAVRSTVTWLRARADALQETQNCGTIEVQQEPTERP